MAFTTGPVELERWFKQGEPVNIVDVRAAEDYVGGISLAHSICRRTSGTSEGREGASPQKQDQRAVLLFKRLPPGRECSGSICEQGLPCDGTRGWSVLVAE